MNAMSFLRRMAPLRQIEAAEQIAKLQPDIAFLDIQMPGLTGLEVAQGIEGSTRVVFVTANPALARMYGYASPEDLLEKVSNIADQIYADPGRREDFINLARRDGLVQDFEMRVRRGDGKTTWTSLNARAVRDASGAVVLAQLRHLRGADAAA